MSHKTSHIDPKLYQMLRYLDKFIIDQTFMKPEYFVICKSTLPSLVLQSSAFYTVCELIHSLKRSALQDS